MILRDSLKSAAFELAANHQVQDVRIGLCYTAVRLDNGQVGLAYTFRDGLKGGCSVVEKNQTLAGSKATALLKYFDSEDFIASAIALATANALFNNAKQDYLVGPSIEQLSLHKDDKVGMIGNFTPLINEIQPRVKQLFVFERVARTEENILPITQAEETLPLCQVALISATAIINNSIDQLLSLTNHCREVVILGSSTPLVQAPFQNTPVTMLSGIIINEPDAILRKISEGQGTPAFKRFVQKVNLSTS